jgi:ferredoxin-NADP reductase
MIIEGLMFLGLLLAGLVAVAVSMLIFGFASRCVGDAKLRKIEHQILAERLEAARCERRKREKSVLPWSGTRKFRIERKEPLCRDVVSFYLTAHDRKPLPEYLPGQYLTFELDAPDLRKRLVRCYSLSDRPRSDHYRVTVKLIRSAADSATPAQGVVSTIFHERLKEGDIIDVRAPGGSFHLDQTGASPVVFIAGGIGVTPLLSMLLELVESGSRREVWFFYGVRNGSEHAFKEQIEKIARENSNVRVHVFYSQPEADDKNGNDHPRSGRLAVDHLRTLLPSNNYDFYLCCPGKMMEEIDRDLRAWGVPEKRIHSEAFGAATLRRTAAVEAPAATPVEFPVHFAKSGRKAMWKGQPDEFLLDVAAACGVAIDSGCRAGNCGTCKVAVKSGQVKYLKEPGCLVEAGTCLTCCCVPRTEIVLDA